MRGRVHQVDQTNAGVGSVTEATFTVTVRLDPFPGWGHHPSDFELLLQSELDRRISHYNPRVSLAEQYADYVEAGSQFFLLIPSSNNAPHDVCGPFASISEAKEARIASGQLLVAPVGDDYVIVRSFDWLWEWEIQTIMHGLDAPTAYAVRNIVNLARFTRSDCEVPR